MKKTSVLLARFVILIFCILHWVVKDCYFIHIINILFKYIDDKFKTKNAHNMYLINFSNIIFSLKLEKHMSLIFPSRLHSIIEKCLSRVNSSIIAIFRIQRNTYFYDF